MDIGQLFGAVARAVNDRTAPAQDVHTGGLLDEVAGLFRQHAGNAGQQIDTSSYENQGPGGILPASQDPYGDPADEGQDILPASQDPYGDPADQQQQFSGRY